MNIEKFCEKYNLGKVRQISKMTGGLMHKMFKVETSKGNYCIKVLNPEVMTRKEAIHNYVISETISNRAKEKGIPVSSALLIDNNYLTKYEDNYYMVFDFANGKNFTDEEITIEHCQKIGNILARIHSLNYQELKLENKRENEEREYDWESFRTNPNFDKKNYQEAYLKNYKKYNSLLKRANERFNASNIESSLCHNDMDPKNVLWEGENPIIINWEVANLSNPYRELIENALCWSGFLSNHFDEDKFAAVIEEYLEIKPIKRDCYNLICGNLVGRFDWLKYNLERSLGICTHDSEEQKLAEKEVSKTIEEINRYVELIGPMYEIICKLTKEANHDYDELIEKIIASNNLLIGKKYEFITAGFTNTIYKVENYIIRICTNLENEKNFQKEIEFYKNNSDNPYIPKMFFSDTTKDIIPYDYEIIEKIEGQTLYEIWYKLDEAEKRKIVLKIIQILKNFHFKESEPYDFKSCMQSKVTELQKKCSLEETLVQKLLNLCSKYFQQNKFGLIHGDLHFDNFLYDGSHLHLIDFERYESAPIDYDLKIFACYKDVPYLWASAKTDMLTVESDYQTFLNLLLENYHELHEIPYIDERLEFYHILELLNDYKNTQNLEKLERVKKIVKELQSKEKTNNNN